MDKYFVKYVGTLKRISYEIGDQLQLSPNVTFDSPKWVFSGKFVF